MDFTVLQKCNFEKVTKETAFSQVIQPIYSILDDFKIKENKIILNFKDYDYIIKIPIFYKFVHKKIEAINLKAPLFSKEKYIFLKAQEEFCDKNFFLPYEECFDFNVNIPIFIQKKVNESYNISNNYIEQFSYEEISYAIKIIFSPQIKNKNLDNKTFLWLLNLGKEIPLKQVINFFNTNQINDLHGGNLGYTIEDNKSVIFDYEF